MAVSDPFKRTAGKAIGRVPSGVFIVTARQGTAASAMMASWVQQAAFDPPAISVAVAKGRPIRDLIDASKVLAVSVIADGDTSLMKKYARGVKPGEDPFAGVETFPTPAGVPALKKAGAWMECRVLQTCDFGADHDLIVAEVTAGEILRPGASFTHLRGSGMHY
jgi:flavin reductase (DIM6/NTAB) family NADH-FMN oxidoreductase RutF